MRKRRRRAAYLPVLALLLSLILLCGGCQSVAVQEVQGEASSGPEGAERVSGAEGEETEDVSGSGGEEAEGASGSEREETDAVYIDVDYVAANYEDEEEDDLSRYKTNGTGQESGSSKTQDTDRDGSASGAVTGTKDTQNGSSSSGGDDDWNGWDEWAEEQDEYLTDPVPEGKPEPVEPQDEVIDTDTSLSCTLYVECFTILDHIGDLTEGKEDLVPSDGVIYGPYTVTFYQGESVYDLLLREMQSNRIHMEAEFTPMYNSAYVQGINNLYEKDCGSLSGWMYCVNGWYPNYGCSRYQLQDGDVVEWHYTCDLGRDLGRE